jgi:pilus assembly protein Flp/PilA
MINSLHGRHRRRSRCRQKSWNSRVFGRSDSPGLRHELGMQTMMEYMRAWLELKVDRRAVTALEYGMIAALIAVVIVGTVSTLGGKLNAAFNSVSTALPAAASR